METTETTSKPSMSADFKMAFFGSSAFSVLVLQKLSSLGILPACIVTTPDKPQGRKMILTPTPVKTWGVENNIKVFDPEKLDDLFVKEIEGEKCDLFVVASYGKIIPKKIIELPRAKTLNIHPSQLPKYRGASPLQSAMLDDAKNTGVTIMRIDDKMDHGPIVAQLEVQISEWPTYEEFEKMMAERGAELLAQILPQWMEASKNSPETMVQMEKEQDHQSATFTKKIVKGDGLIDLANGRPYDNFRKIQAFHQWPQAYFLITHRERQIRVKITEASYEKETDRLVIKKVIPEGAKEMSYDDFLRGYAKSTKSTS